MTSAGLFTGGILGAMAIALAALGLWARGAVAALAPPSMTEQQREKRARVLNRGGVTCLVLAVVFIAVAIVVAI